MLEICLKSKLFIYFSIIIASSFMISESYASSNDYNFYEPLRAPNQVLNLVFPDFTSQGADKLSKKIYREQNFEKTILKAISRPYELKLKKIVKKKKTLSASHLEKVKSKQSFRLKLKLKYNPLKGYTKLTSRLNFRRLNNLVMSVSHCDDYILGKCSYRKMELAKRLALSPASYMSLKTFYHHDNRLIQQDNLGVGFSFSKRF